MKVSYDVESKTIQILVTSGTSSISEALTPEEAILFADMIRNMAITLRAKVSKPGATPRHPPGADLS